MLKLHIKVPGQAPYDGIFPSHQAAQADAEVHFPDAPPASIINLDRLKALITPQGANAAPGRRPLSHCPPKMVFFSGATADYLREPTGDRRWWVIKE